MNGISKIASLLTAASVILLCSCSPEVDETSLKKDWPALKQNIINTMLNDEISSQLGNAYVTDDKSIIFVSGGDKEKIFTLTENPLSSDFFNGGLGIIYDLHKLTPTTIHDSFSPIVKKRTSNFLYECEVTVKIYAASLERKDYTPVKLGYILSEEGVSRELEFQKKCREESPDIRYSLASFAKETEKLGKISILRTQTFRLCWHRKTEKWVVENFYLRNLDNVRLNAEKVSSTTSDTLESFMKERGYSLIDGIWYMKDSAEIENKLRAGQLCYKGKWVPAKVYKETVSIDTVLAVPEKAAKGKPVMFIRHLAKTIHAAPDAMNRAEALKLLKSKIEAEAKARAGKVKEMLELAGVVSAPDFADLDKETVSAVTNEAARLKKADDERIAKEKAAKEEAARKKREKEAAMLKSAFDKKTAALAKRWNNAKKRDSLSQHSEIEAIVADYKDFRKSRQSLPDIKENSAAIFGKSLEIPSYDVEKYKKTVEDKVEKEISLKKFNAEYEKAIADTKAQAAKIYVPLEKGKVETVTYSSRGGILKESGKYYGISENRRTISIGMQTISVVDLTDDIKARLSPESAEAARKAMVDEMEQKYAGRRRLLNSKRAALHEKLASEIPAADGYIFHDKKWLSPGEVVNMAIKK